MSKNQKTPSIFKSLQPDQIYGNWKIIEVFHQTRKVKVLCTCCNITTRTTLYGNIISDSSRSESCGCIKKQNSQRYKLQGETFNYLTIIHPSNNNPRKVVCKCVCGTEREYFLLSLKSGETKSCGCKTTDLRRQAYVEKYQTDKFFTDQIREKAINVTKANSTRGKLKVGDIYGNWKITEVPPQGQQIRVICLQCNQTEKLTRYTYIINDEYRPNSCGCVKIERQSKIVGRRYHALEIISKTFIKNNTQYVKVRCDCGTEKEISYTNLRSGHYRSCGCLRETLRKQTCLEKYGTEFAIQNREIRERVVKIRQENGDFHNIGGKTISQIAKETNIPHSNLFESS